MEVKLRGIRGATTVEVDQEAVILAATEKLVVEMIRSNQIDPDEVASVWMTVTEDLSAAFPAKALRTLQGWEHVPVMCSREIPVPNSLAKCIRVLMHVHTAAAQKEIQHIYMERAVQLRPDLKSMS